MRKFFIGAYDVFIREWGRIFGNATYTSILFVLPVISLLFFAIFFGRGGLADNLPVALVDEDNSTLSRKLCDMVEQTPAVELRVVVPNVNEGLNLIRKGEVYAILHIPANFEHDILSGSQAIVELYNSGANISTNSLIAKDVQTAVTTMSVGTEVQILQKQGMPASAAMAQAMPIRFVKHVLFNPYINYGYYVAPCFMAMMLLLFTVLSTAYSVGSELKYRTSEEWNITARGSIMAAILGKLAPITLVMSLIAMIMLIILFIIMGAPLNGSIWVLALGTLIFIISYQSIAVAILSVTSNLRLALSLGGGYSVLAFTFSGLTFPTMAMAMPLQWLSYLFPFTFYMRLYVNEAMRGAPLSASITDMAYMMLFWILPLFFINRLRRISRNSKYWGRA